VEMLEKSYKLTSNQRLTRYSLSQLQSH